MITGDFFITPHAVRQFQNRIAPWMNYEQALGAIIRELRDVKEFRSTFPGGNSERRYFTRSHYNST
jgi:hypothetical protein